MARLRPRPLRAPTTRAWRRAPACLLGPWGHATLMLVMYTGGWFTLGRLVPAYASQGS